MLECLLCIKPLALDGTTLLIIFRLEVIQNLSQSLGIGIQDSKMILSTIG